jgi:hypothetical protein
MLGEYIDDAFTDAEIKHDLTIPHADKQFLHTIIPKIIESHVAKFVQGAIDHHDSPFTDLSPDQMIEELTKEITDAPFYAHGYFYVKALRSKNV